MRKVGLENGTLTEHTEDKKGQREASCSIPNEVVSVDGKNMGRNIVRDNLLSAKRDRRSWRAVVAHVLGGGRQHIKLEVSSLTQVADAF